MRDGDSASDAPALLILPQRRERRRPDLARGRRAAAVWPTSGVRTRWNRSKRERSPQVLSFHPRPGRVGGIFHRGENGGGAEWGRSGRGRAGPGDTCGPGPGAFFLPTRRRLASLRRLPAQVLGFPSPRVPFGASCGSRAGLRAAIQGPGWVEVANWPPCALPGPLIGSPGRGSEVGLWGGCLWRSGLGLCARGDLGRHLWSRGPEPPVQRDPSVRFLSVPRCGQLPKSRPSA